jgi:hypothetical protein
MGFFVPMLATLGAGASTGAAAGAVGAELAATTAAGLATVAAPTGIAASAGAGITASQVLLGASVVGAGASALGTYQAGQAAKAQYRMQAKQEADAARGREIDRRRDLIRAIASQAATAGAMGASTRSGTGLAGIAQYDINQANRDAISDRVNTGRMRNMLLKAGKNAASTGGIGAAASLLDSAVDIGRNGVR